MDKKNFLGKIKDDSIWQRVAIILVCVYMLAGIPKMSMLSINPDALIYDGILPVVACIVLGMRVYNRLAKNKWAWVYGTGAWLGSYLFLLFIPEHFTRYLLPLVMGAALIGINYSRVLKAVLYTVIPTLVMVIILSRTGLITNLVYYVSGVPRLTFGAVYCTDFAAYIFYMTMAFAVIDTKVPKYIRGIICFGIAIILYFFCRSTCSSFCLGVAGIGCIYVNLYEYFSIKDKCKLIINRFNKVINFLEISMFALLAILYIALTLFYGTYDEWIIKVNDKLHNRIVLGYQALREYGFSMFGNSGFVPVGAGATTNSQFQYNYVDSSYMYTIISWGYMLLIVLCIWYVFIVLRSQKSKNYIVPMALAVIAIHSFEEQHYIEPWFNVFLFTYLCRFEYKEERVKFSITSFCVAQGKRIKKFVCENKSKAILTLCVCTILIAEILLVPMQSAMLRAMVEAKGLRYNGTTLIISYVCLFIFIVWFVLGIYYIIGKSSNKNKPVIISFAIITVLIVGLNILQYREAISEKDFYESDIEKDEILLQKLSTAGVKEKIFIDSYDGYYVDNKNVKEAFLYDEELGLIDNFTYLCDSNYERFNGMDLYMVEFDEGRMLYTTSDNMVTALGNMGYVVQNKYPKVWEFVESNTSVQLSNCITEDDSDKLVSSFKTQICNMRSGIYKIEIMVDLLNINDESYEVFTLNTVYPGRVYTKRIHESDIVEGKYSVYTSISNCDSLYFSIMASEGVDINIESMTIQKCD